MNRVVRCISFYFVAFFSIASAAIAGSWHPEKPVPEGAGEVVSSVAGDKIFLYGGLDENGPVGLFWMYDPREKKWTKLPTNPLPVHHAAMVGIGDKLFLFGGFKKASDGGSSWVPVNNAWIFDIQKQSWSELAPMPTARGALTAVAAKNKIFVIGGAMLPSWSRKEGLGPGVPTEQSTANEVYNPATNKWSVARPMLSGRNHLNAAYVNGKIYVIGGRVGSAVITQASNVSANEVYDPAKDEWEPKAPMPSARSGLGVVPMDGLIHVLGGEEWNHNQGGVFRQHEVYDPKSDTWQLAAPMSTPRHGFGIAVLHRKIYVISGTNNAGGSGPHNPLKSIEVYEEE